MCSYNLDDLLLSSYAALHKLFPHVDESKQILPCAILAGFQLITSNKKELEMPPDSLHIESFETPKVEMIPLKSEADALREVIIEVYKDPSTGWLKIKNVYEEYIQKKEN